MDTLTLSVTHPGEPFHDVVCAFEAAFLKKEYDAAPILAIDAGVAIHNNGIILAAATYASGLSNNPLIAEVAAPDAFLQADGTPFPRDVIAEYAGRMFDDTLAKGMALRLQLADVLSLTMYRIARVSNISLLAGVSGKSEKSLYRRIELVARIYPLGRDEQDRVENHFNDRWDIYFAKPRYVTNIITNEQASDGLENWKRAVAGLTCDQQTLKRIAG